MRWPIEERLFRKTNKTETCWLYFGGRNKDGYGHMRINRKMKSVHRVSYELAYGEIPLGLSVLHHCDTPNCVRPDHLFLGTQDDNIKDCAAKQRTARLKGETNPRAILTADDVLKIRAEYKPKVMGYKRLADKFGVVLQTIHAIVSRATWKHI